MEKYTRVQKEKEPTGEDEIRITAMGLSAWEILGWVFRAFCPRM